mgnify:CR=1 FL=1
MALVIKERNSGDVIASGYEEDDSIRYLEGCWYYKPDCVDMTHLVVTDRTYTCPYKGICYWIDLETSETQVRNVAFVYRQPMDGYEYIEDRIAFYARDTSGTIACEEISA